MGIKYSECTKRENMLKMTNSQMMRISCKIYSYNDVKREWKDTHINTVKLLTINVVDQFNIPGKGLVKKYAGKIAITKNIYREKYF